MNSPIDKAWSDAAANPGTSIDIGRIVVCDACSIDYTDSLEMGGLIAGSYAYCPKCANRMQLSAREVRARCPTLKAFADFVRDYRGPGGNKITIHAGIRSPVPTSRSSQCIECKSPFSAANTRSEAGWRETQMSGLCENCFDAAFDEDPDEEDVGDICEHGISFDADCAQCDEAGERDYGGN